MNENNKSLNDLRERYPNQTMLPAICAGKELGFKPQTTRNKINDGTFPVMTSKLEGKRLVHILNLADILEAQRLGKEVSHG